MSGAVTAVAVLGAAVALLLAAPRARQSAVEREHETTTSTDARNGRADLRTASPSGRAESAASSSRRRTAAPAVVGAPPRRGQKSEHFGAPPPGVRAAGAASPARYSFRPPPDGPGAGFGNGAPSYAEDSASNRLESLRAR